MNRKPEFTDCPTCGSKVLVEGNVTRYFVTREEVLRQLLESAKESLFHFQKIREWIESPRAEEIENYLERRIHEAHEVLK